MKLKKYSIYLVFVTLIVVSAGCNNVAKFSSIAKESNVINVSNTYSAISFAGIDSVDSVTDSTAVIHWTNINGAKAYQLFKVENTVQKYIKTFDENISNYLIKDLIPNKVNVFRLKLIDEDGNLDSNENDISFVTKNAPNIPSSISLYSPTQSIFFDSTPTIKIAGIKFGDTVRLFTDSSCLNEVGSAVAGIEDFVYISSSQLSVGLYNFYANSTGLNSSACSISHSTYEVISCPSNFISVPANNAFGINKDFCVMKFEAKAWKDNNGDNIVDTNEINLVGCLEAGCSTSDWGLQDYTPVSNSYGKSWRKISQEGAWNRCDSLNSENSRLDIFNDIHNDGTFSLISNSEWMTIAANIENLGTNWTSGIVGTGCLKRGNVGNNLTCGGVNSGYNSPTDPDYGVNRQHNNTALLSLSNGENLWDFSGNVSEWVDWSIENMLLTNIIQNERPYLSTDGASISSWIEFSSLDIFTNIIPSSSILPNNHTYDSSNGIGKYYGHTSGGAAQRGGYWFDKSSAGIFSLSFKLPSDLSRNTVGFRCVYRKP